MSGFIGFLENRKIDLILEECSQLMREIDTEPHRYIYESLLEVDPVFAENWWQGVSDFAGNVWKGVTQFVGDVGKGAQTGYNRAVDTIAGPVSKFDAVDRALQDLVNVLKKPEFQNFKSKGDQGKTVAQYLEKVLGDLRQDKNNIPQMQPTQVNQSYGTRQNAQQNKQGGQRQPSQASKDMISNMDKWQRQRNSPFGAGGKLDRWQQQQQAAAAGGS